MFDFYTITLYKYINDILLIGAKQNVKISIITNIDIIFGSSLWCLKAEEKGREGMPDFSGDSAEVVKL